MRMLILAAAPLALTGCMTDDGYESRQYAEADAEVAERLAGYKPAGTRNCLPSRSSGGFKVYENGTVVARQGGSLYVQDLGAGCARASSAHTTLVTEGTFGNMCSGTIARVVDSTTGIFSGSCSINEWTEYERVENADEAS